MFRGTFGRLGPSGFTETRDWGVMHHGCHERSENSPEFALAKIKKLAKASTSIVSSGKSKSA